MNRDVIFAAIAKERDRQHVKFGIDHTCASRAMHPYEKVAVLTEEVGEAAHAAIELARQGTNIPHVTATVYELIAELVQVAAVAVAWLESITDPDA